MVARLPVDVTYRLPVGWASIPPDKIQTPGVAFCAGHLASLDDEFLANITIAGDLWPRPAPLSTLADEAVRSMREDPTYPQVEVLERREITQPAMPKLGSPAVRALRQVLNVRRHQDDAEQRLIVVQTYQPVPYPQDPRQEAVLNICLTATPTQLEKLTGDFEYFHYSVLQRTLGVKYFGSLEEVDSTKVTATANAAADAVRDIAATADEWATVGWDTLAEGDGSR